MKSAETSFQLRKIKITSFQLPNNNNDDDDEEEETKSELETQRNETCMVRKQAN